MWTFSASGKLGENTVIKAIVFESCSMSTFVYYLLECILVRDVQIHTFQTSFRNKWILEILVACAFHVFS